MRLLYLHGFRSSPLSTKAQAVARYCTEHGLPAPIMPQLPLSPRAAVQMCEDLVAQQSITAVCGSSLGGFYALYLAQQFGLRCVLINPAITPWVDLERVDNHVRYEIDALEGDRARLIAELKQYYVPHVIEPQSILLLTGLADEVLDARQAIDHLAGARQIVVPDGDHGLSDFGGYLDEIMTFLLR